MRTFIFNLRLFAILLVISSSLVSVAAQQPSTQYVSASYQEFEDQIDFDGIGFKVAGRIGEQWLLSGSYNEVSASNGGDAPLGVDWDITRVRAGYGLYQHDGIVFQAGPQVMYLSYEIANSMLSDSQTRFGAFAALAYQITTNLELSGDVSYVDIDTASGNTLLQYSLGGRFYLFERLSLDAEARFGEWDGLAVGVSFHF